ncbi:hypothetical protein LIA77_05245 [Sarocladium implicatum]|nr:hypothetical protein LIA77_05245 [Sarocladium implicatum]
MGLDLAEAALVVRGSNNRCRREDGARRSMGVGEWFLGGRREAKVSERGTGKGMETNRGWRGVCWLRVSAGDRGTEQRD